MLAHRLDLHGRHVLDRIIIERQRVGPRLSSYEYSALGGPTTDVPSDTLRASPILLLHRVRIDQIGQHIAGAGAAGAKSRLGVYDDRGDIYPGNLLVDAGEIDASTIGAKNLAVDLTLDPGFYWIVFNTNDATIDLYFMWMHIYRDNRPNYQGLSIAQAYGPLPSTFPDGASPDTPFLVYYRIAEYLE